MRKSGWAAAAGLGSLVLLLAACGGSSSSSSAVGAASSTVSQSTAVSSSIPATTASAGTPTAKAKGTPASGGSTRHTAEAQPTSDAGVSFPPIGTTVMVVQRSKLGFVLAEANQQVVYTYSKDGKGGRPTCTGSCATVWLPVTGVPKAGPADTFPATFGLVAAASGVRQITYNGYPLYTYKGAAPLSVPGEGIDGEWHVVMLSASDITG